MTTQVVTAGLGVLSLSELIATEQAKSGKERWAEFTKVSAFGAAAGVADIETHLVARYKPK